MRIILIILLLATFVSFPVNGLAASLKSNEIGFAVSVLLSSHFEMDDTDLPEIQSMEKETPDNRIPSKEKIEKLKTNDRFNYEVKERKPSLWKIIKSYLKYYIEKATRTVLGYVVIFIIVFVFVWLLIKISGIKPFQRKIKNTSEFNIETEDINEMNFDILIQNALANRDYRLCIRLMYLRNLKTMSDMGIINWTVNKTNYSYLCEIRDTALYDSFLNQTILFDYVWYGSVGLDDTTFYEARERVDNFNFIIKNSRQ